MNHQIGAAGMGAAREVASWVPPMARLGYAAKGVVYLLIGFIAFKAANAAGSPEGASGALASLRDESGGKLMLMLIALGLLGHVLWRLVQAAMDPEHPGDKDAKRIAMRLFYLLSAVIYGSLAYTAWQLSRGSGGGGGEGQEVWINKVLGMPAGSWLVMAAGIGVIAYGLHQIVKALRGDVNSHMQQNSRAVTTLGRIGTGARGLVLMPIGWFVFNAGRHYSASTAADTGEVLQMLDRGGLLAIVGLGLFAYGLHQIAKAVYRRINRPT